MLSTHGSAPDMAIQRRVVARVNATPRRLSRVHRISKLGETPHRGRNAQLANGSRDRARTKNAI